MGMGGMGMGGAMAAEITVPIEPIIGAVVGYSGGTMGGGMGGGRAGGGMMGAGVRGGMPAMGGQGMAWPSVGGGLQSPVRPGDQPMAPGGRPMMPGGGAMMPGAGIPGGMGGMPGAAGSMGMQMKPPTKATLEITTEWYVYDKTAGISQYAVVTEEGEQVGGAVTEVRSSEAFAHKHALGGAGAASKEGSTFVVDLKASSFRPVGRYYLPKEHEEIVTRPDRSRPYLLRGEPGGRGYASITSGHDSCAECADS